jgi:hypothetical protein
MVIEEPAAIALILAGNIICSPIPPILKLEQKMGFS